MSASRTCTCHRNMGQGSQIVQRKAFAVQIFAKRTISDPTLNGHGMMFSIQGDDLIEMFQRDKIFSAIGNAIEGVTTAEYPQFIATAHNLLDLLDSRGEM